MGFLKDAVTEYATSHYHSMPKSVQKKMMDEGKKKIENDHPIISTFISEKKKEQLVENYFTKKEVERYKKNSSFWDDIF